MPLIELLVKGAKYFSPGDEKAFFDWLQSISCVESAVGQSRDLRITLRKQPSSSELRELIALLYCYKLDMRPLAALKNSRNVEWFGATDSYWYVPVFGRRTKNAQKSRLDVEC
jgi:hypothetical protein